MLEVRTCHLCEETYYRGAYQSPHCGGENPDRAKFYGEASHSFPLKPSSIVVVIGLVLLLIWILSGCVSSVTSFVKRLTYEPDAEEAFSYAAGYAEIELATYQPDPFLNPGCEHRPQWFMDRVDDQGSGRFSVHGRVVVGNVYCVKDQSSFHATIQYSDNEWYLVGSVAFSNPCVLDRTFDHIPDKCMYSEWEGP